MSQSSDSEDNTCLTTSTPCKQTMTSVEKDAKADLTRLRKARGLAKQALTRLEKYFASSELSDQDEICIRHKTLKETFAKIQELQLAISCIDGSDDEMEQIEERYYKLSATISKIKANFSTSEISHNVNTSTRIPKLPNINILPFNGDDIAAYKPFMDLYMAVIDSSKDLSSIEKLYYLRTLCKGEALQIIEGLPVSHESYQQALQLLNKRYDNPWLLINNHVTVLINMSNIQRGTAHQLRELVTRTRQNCMALQNLNQPVEHWDAILICIIIKKLDPLTARLYHSERNFNDIPTLCDLLSFLEKRAASLEASPTPGGSFKPKGSVSLNSSVIPHKHIKCALCAQQHRLYKCPQFALMSSFKKNAFVTNNNICKICLGTHSQKCRYHFYCSVCKSKGHNTALHCGNEEQQQPSNQTTEPAVSVLSFKHPAAKVLLPTVKVLVNDAHGNKLVVRGILDSGSQSSFCTKGLIDKLGLEPFSQNLNIVTLGEQSNKLHSAANLIISSMTEHFQCNITCSVVEHITAPLPQRRFESHMYKIPKAITLADNEFNVPGNIMLLLGADIFFRVLKDGKIEGGPADPILINTRFGYIISGDNFPCSNLLVSTMHTVVNSDLDIYVKKFWETEKVPEIFLESLPEHEHSEKVFKDSAKLTNNRFEVKLPLKVSMQQIDSSQSFAIALQRFYNLEKRFMREPLYKKMYFDFIQDYIDLGHAKFINTEAPSRDEQPIYFLPHHAVLKSDKITNKLRTVFDGSAKTKTSISLNEMLSNGPVVQKQLFDILLQFRTYKYTIICDIRHMFRQILVHPDHRVLQNILWRNSPTESIKCIQLQTVTYGLTCSTYLATRCLVELAKLNMDTFPLASRAILYNSYTDDIISGENTIISANQLKSELINLLKLAGFELHKWCSNEITLLNDIPTEKLGFTNRILDWDKLTVKTLGLSYHTKDDVFKLTGTVVTPTDIPTKRSVLSSISKFFDPMGFAGPLTVRAKLILQQIWQGNLQWDVPLPSGLANVWFKFQSEISSMSPICIKRDIQLYNSEHTELIGYCDASTEAYGCCVYIKVYIQNKYYIYLLCSKSKIAPLNSKLTVPKLELNSALLLAKLIAKVSDTLPNIKSINLFSDSKIVLGWLHCSITSLPAYIANRVKDIILKTSHMTWRHTPGLLNPADILSRGASPSSINTNELWWHGPDYLLNSNYNLYSSVIEAPIIPNSFLNNMSVSMSINDSEQGLWSFYSNYSSYTKMQRIMCYIFRFINKCKNKTLQHNKYITVSEVKSASEIIIRGIQTYHFGEELRCIQQNKQITSNLKSLHPFVDGKGLLRVGGRLQHSNLAYARKFPIILPNKCHVTKLIIINEHISLLHAGLKLITSSLCQKYHIINGQKQIKSVIHKCLICHKFKAEGSKQLMGTLPRERVTPARPFERVGVDYCGPFEIKQHTIRRSVLSKGYVAVFVCFTTKAVHLELVADLTTEAFLAALKRFISRRGCPSNVYCDNATTFKGANNVLNSLYKLHQSSDFQNSIANFTTSKGIQFHFIPAYSPAQGGIWEAAVRSAKTIFKRVTGSKQYTFEQFQTLLCEIESILNSRPLTGMSNEPTDYAYLTPGHFLIGCALNSFPQPDISEIPANRLKYWRCCEQMRQHFWRAWSNEYLHLLNKRTKWHKEYPNLQEGMIVLLKNHNTPVFQWPLGRIHKVYKGTDSKVRIVDIKTADGKIHSRAIARLVVLPTDDN